MRRISVSFSGRILLPELSALQAIDLPCRRIIPIEFDRICVKSPVLKRPKNSGRPYWHFFILTAMHLQKETQNAEGLIVELIV